MTLFGKLRGWTDFGDLSRLSVPGDVDKMFTRVSTNLRYFQSNYIVVALVLFVVVGIQKPLFLASVLILVAVGIIAALWVKDNEDQIETVAPWIVGGAIAGSILLFITGGAPFVAALSISLLLTVIHALFMKPSIKSKATNFFYNLVDSMDSRHSE